MWNHFLSLSHNFTSYFCKLVPSRANFTSKCSNYFKYKLFFLLLFYLIFLWVQHSSTMYCWHHIRGSWSVDPKEDSDKKDLQWCQLDKILIRMTREILGRRRCFPQVSIVAFQDFPVMFCCRFFCFEYEWNWGWVWQLCWKDKPDRLNEGQGLFLKFLDVKIWICRWGAG